MPYATFTSEQKDDGNGKTTSEDKFVYLKDKVLPINEAAELGHKKAYIINLFRSIFSGRRDNTGNPPHKSENVFESTHKPRSSERKHYCLFLFRCGRLRNTKNIAPLEKVKLCDTVTVKFAKLGVSAKAKVIKTVYDVLAEKYKSIELGDAKSNFAQTVLDQNKAIAGITTLVKKGACKCVNRAQRGHKKCDKPYNRQQRRLCSFYTLRKARRKYLYLIAPDIESAVRVWRWNSAGLGYSKKRV